jgi:phosphohistidine swiveling domain-containing protein
MPEFKFLKDKDAWELGEEIPDMDNFFSQIWLSCFANEFKEFTGRAYKKILTVYEGYHLWFYFGEKDSFEVGQNIVEKFLKNPQFTVKVNKEIVKESDKLRKFAESLPEERLDRLSNQKIWQYYNKHDKLHTSYYQWGWIPVAVDMFHNNLTNTLKDYLKGKGLSDEKASEYFSVLTQPEQKSLIQIEQEDFLKVAAVIQQDKYHKKLFKDLYRVFEEKEAMPFGLATHTPEYERSLEEKTDSIKEKIKPKILKLIDRHYRKYFYVKYMWIGKTGVNGFDYYLKELVKFIGRDSPAKKLLKEKQTDLKKVIKQRKQLFKKLKVESKWKLLFDAFGDFMITKIYRRYAQIYAIYRMQAVLEEIAKRFSLSKKQVRFMLNKEVKAALFKNKIDRRRLQQRTQFSVYLVEPGKEAFFEGDKAKKLAKLVKPKKLEEVKELIGQTGCVGRAKGRVKIIIRPADMPKMKKGDILVSIATDPDIVPAMKRAAAIVTEQGGVTSHAAIVSREMNIPCVIGTKIATRALKDGDLVEVDATKGIVRKL